MVRNVYEIRCPECNMPIKRVESIEEIPKNNFICYSCEKEITLASEDIKEVFVPRLSKGEFK